MSQPKGFVFGSFLLLDFDHRQRIQSLCPREHAFVAQRPAISSGGKKPSSFYDDVMQGFFSIFFSFFLLLSL
jgi:hypothetical protein